MPNVPEMHIARGIDVPAVPKIQPPDRGRRGPEGDVGGQCINRPFQRCVQAGIDRKVPVTVVTAFFIPVQRADHLVVAAPQRHAWLTG